MARPENIQEPFVGGLFRIKIHLNRLRVVTEAVIRGILLFATRITDPGSHYPVVAPKLGVRPPESAQSKRGALYPFGNDSIYQRNFFGDYMSVSHHDQFYNKKVILSTYLFDRT